MDTLLHKYFDLCCRLKPNVNIPKISKKYIQVRWGISLRDHYTKILGKVSDQEIKGKN